MKGTPNTHLRLVSLSGRLAPFGRWFMVICLCFGAHICFGQNNLWDMPVTEILVNQNKRSIKDYESFRDKQMFTTTQAVAWRDIQTKTTTLYRKLEKQTLNMFQIAADASVLYDVILTIQEMLKVQAETVQLAYDNPWAIETVIRRQQMIYKRGQKLYQFIGLLVASYTDLNKMKISERKKIYFALRSDVRVMLGEVYSCNRYLKSASLAHRSKKSQLEEYISRDKRKVDEILRNMKW